MALPARLLEQAFPFLALLWPSGSLSDVATELIEKTRG